MPPSRPLAGWIWPGRAGSRPDRLPATAVADYFPLASYPIAQARCGPLQRRHSSRSKIVVPGHPQFHFGRKRCGAKETGRDYFSVKLDDPSFPTPIYASLVEMEGDKAGYSLIWSR